jgi:hypothetical protein
VSSYCHGGDPVCQATVPELVSTQPDITPHLTYGSPDPSGSREAEAAAWRLIDKYALGAGGHIGQLSGRVLIV